MIRLFLDAWKHFNKISISRSAAALAYYSIFALSPILILLLVVAQFFGETAILQSALGAELGSVLGESGQAWLQGVFSSTTLPVTSLTPTALLAGIIVIVGISGLFVEIKSVLNMIWHVEVTHAHRLAQVQAFIVHRILGFIITLLLGIIFVLSVGLSAVLSIYSQGFSFFAVHPSAYLALNSLSLLLTVYIIFTLLYKIVPDTEVSWTAASHGGIVAAILFLIGKGIMSLYVSTNGVSTLYGATGAFIGLLIWIYYSSQIFYFGAVFSQTWSRRRIKE